MLVPIRMGTNMAAGNQQRHLSLSFAQIYLPRNSKTLKNAFFNTRTVQMAKFPEISPEKSHFLTNSVVMEIPRHAKA